MSESFDPYKKWLAIPVDEQPPHHYRLLGVPVFEKDADVVETAADQRMMLLRSFHAGQHSTLSQQLLNEISAAKVCLLNPQSRAAYDSELQRKLAGAATPKAAAPKPKNSKPDRMPAPQIAASASSDSKQLPKKNFWQSPVLIGGAVATVLVLIIAITVAATRTSPGADRVADAGGQEPNAADPNRRETDDHKSSSTATIGTKDSKQDDSDAVAVAFNNSDSAKADQTVDPSPEQIQQDTDVAHEPPTTTDSVEAQIDATKNSQTGSEATLAEPAPEKLAVPDEDAQKQAQARIKELFSADIAAAKSAEKRLELTQTLLRLGKETDDDIAARYEMLRMAGAMAASLADVETALAAVDAMAEYYEIDEWQMRLSALTAVSKSARGADITTKRKRLAETAVALVPEALAVGNYDAAGRLVQIGLRAARSAKAVALIKQCVLLHKEVAAVKTANAMAEKAFAILETEPDDADANLTAGRFLCLLRADWQGGLPLLAKASDETLRDLAKKDLAAPTDSKTQIDVGDRWWESSEAEEGLSQKQMQGRAGHWYRLALPQVTSTLMKAKLTRRIEQIGATGADPSAGSSGSRYALRFAGRDFVTMASARKALNLSATFTVEMWVRWPRDEEMRLMGTNIGAPNNPRWSSNAWRVALASRTPPRKIGLHFATSPNGGSGINARDAVAVGDWHHVVVCHDPDVATAIFLDGKVAKKSRIRQYHDESVGVFRIGCEPSFASSFFGDVAAVRLSSNYRYTQDFQPPTPREMQTDDDTIAVLDFSRSRGERIEDLSGNEHHGIISGAKWIELDEEVKVAEPMKGGAN